MKHEKIQLILKDGSVNMLPIIREENLITVENQFIEDVIVPRIGGMFQNKAIYLSNDYNWTIGKDDYDNLVLIPTVKGNK